MQNQLASNATADMLGSGLLENEQRTVQAQDGNTTITNVPPFDTPTVFDSILAGTLPCHYIYEDDVCVAFDDINPQAPVHFVVIPKNKDGIDRISMAEEKHIHLLGYLLYAAKHVASTIKGLYSPNESDRNSLSGGGYRIVINDGEVAGQSVPHLHVHVLSGRPFQWPPG